MPKHMGKKLKNTNETISQSGDKPDRLSTQQRSVLMSKVHATDTKPEIMLRKELFHRGFRYRKNVANLPGKPDIVLPKYCAIVFIHGCFWHQHPGCKEAIRPKSRQEYWEVKLDRNIKRDAETIEKLTKLGWRVYIVWECELRPHCRQQTIDNLISALRSLKPSL
jgi:DNA mismatch endonuclease (patch repair protein)